ncbi:MAG: DM13 domain-containing protein, partial [Bacteroidota bacterium]
TEKEIEIVKEAEKISSGTFMNGVHPTSGKVEIVLDKIDTKKKYLSFTGFKTDAGPDLRIYLSEEVKPTNYSEVSKLTKSGDFLVELPSSASPDKQKYVLIYCQKYSVLFGSAKLE